MRLASSWNLKLSMFIEEDDHFDLEHGFGRPVNCDVLNLVNLYFWGKFALIDLTIVTR